MTFFPNFACSVLSTGKQKPVITINGPGISRTTVWRNWTTWKNRIRLGIKMYSANTVHSLSTEANHLCSTKPPNCLLLWRNYPLEAGWLRHNKNSKWLMQLLVPGPGVAHFKASSRRQSIFSMNKEERFIDHHQKLFIQIFVRNLLPAEQFSKSC